MNGDENFSHLFIYTKVGYVENILLSLGFENYSINICLWNDDNDDRKFNEKTNEYEDLEKFIVKKYKNILKDMSKITKYLIK